MILSFERLQTRRRRPGGLGRKPEDGEGPSGTAIETAGALAAIWERDGPGELPADLPARIPAESPSNG
jgi:hypothetical protein